MPEGEIRNAVGDKTVNRRRYGPIDLTVARMTGAARSECRENLIMPPHEWKKLVLSYVESGVSGFGIEIVNRVAPFESMEVANRWLALAMDIWNAMPESARRLSLSQMELDRLSDGSCAAPANEIEMDGQSAAANQRKGEPEYARL
jgi:hypothetical protein